MFHHSHYSDPKTLAVVEKLSHKLKEKTKKALEHAGYSAEEAKKHADSHDHVWHGHEKMSPGLVHWDAVAAHLLCSPFYGLHYECTDEDVKRSLDQQEDQIVAKFVDYHLRTHRHHG